MHFAFLAMVCRHTRAARIAGCVCGGCNLPPEGGMIADGGKAYPFPGGVAVGDAAPLFSDCENSKSVMRFIAERF